MENQKTNQQFRENELAFIKRWDKERQEYITNAHPKIGGRLRLAHEANEELSIETEIVKYDGSIAVVLAVCRTGKGSFKGIGMSSNERDTKIAPAILELAETRAIARSLRFAGYGVEYCSAEEVSHLNNGNGQGNPANQSQPNQRRSCSEGGNGNGNRSRPPRQDNGNGNGRLTSKQYGFILKLNDEMGRHTSDLDRECQEMFGTVAQHLSKADASSLIEKLLGQQAN